MMIQGPVGESLLSLDMNDVMIEEEAHENLELLKGQVKFNLERHQERYGRRRIERCYKKKLKLKKLKLKTHSVT